MAKPPSTPEFLDGLVETHAIRPGRLRADDFDGFFDDRKERLLTMISEAMGKPAIREMTAVEEETYEEEPADEDLVEEELSA